MKELWHPEGSNTGQSVSTLCIPIRLFLPQPFLFNTQCHRQASLSLLCTKYFSSLFFFYFFSLKEPGLLCSAGVSLSLLGHRPFLYHFIFLSVCSLPSMLSPPLLFLIPLPNSSCPTRLKVAFFSRSSHLCS